MSGPVRRLSLLLLAAALAGCFDLDRLRGTDAGAPFGDLAALADLAPPDDLFGPLSRCGTSAVQLCEGFEGDLSHWGTIIHGGSVNIDSSRYYLGTHSLAVHADANVGSETQAEISESETFPSTTSFLRAFVYLPKDTPPIAIRLMTVYQKATPFQGISLSVTPTSAGFAPSVFDGITNSTVDTASAGFATDRWTCLEFEVAQANPGTVRVWVDDNEYGDLAISSDTTTAPAFGVISFGLLHSSSSTAHTLSIDGIIVDDKRIGCDKSVAPASRYRRYTRL